MKIIAYPGDTSACSYYRIHKPLSEARKAGYDIEMSERVEFEHLIGKKITDKEFAKIQEKIKKDPALESKLNFKPKYDLYVFQRQHDRPNWTRMRYLLEQGAAVVYEMDDNLFSIDKTNPAYTHFMEPEAQQTIAECCQMATALTVSTDYLKKVLSPLNQAIAVLPNSLDLNLWNKYRDQRAEYFKNPADKKIRIGYAGSPTHFLDFRIIRNVIPAVLRRNANIKFKFIGTDWSQIFKKEFAGLENQLESVNYRGLEDWQEALIDINIGLAPLADTEFNRCKSNLKWLEYSALNIPTIASKVEPYAKSIDDGKTGILIGGDSEAVWTREILSLVNSTAKREYLASNARAEVERKYNLENNWKLWIAVYQFILESMRNADKAKKTA